MSAQDYRPICDTWILARPKVKYYGAYPSGFLSRARELLGVHENEAVLHVCGGAARAYPFRGFGPNDMTLDLNEELEPSYIHDVREPLPLQDGTHKNGKVIQEEGLPWPAIIADPPYTLADAREYKTESQFPDPNVLLKTCLDAVRVGGRVGFLHYILPRPPKSARFVACVGVIVGYGNRMRVYSVFERKA